MPAFINERNRWVLFVNEFKVDKLAASTDSGVKILVVELDREAKLFGIETDRRCHIRCSQLRCDALDRHIT